MSSTARSRDLSRSASTTVRVRSVSRVVSVFATFAYLADVYVLEEYRGRGLALWLMEVIRSHPRLANLRRWMLATRDAHPLYRKVGFVPLAAPDRFMEIADPEIYRRKR